MRAARLRYGLFVAAFLVCGPAVAADGPITIDADPCHGAPYDFSTIDAEDAFARDIRDLPTLRFLAHLEAADRPARAAMLHALATSKAPPVAMETDVGDSCRVADIPFAVVRAEAILQYRWLAPEADIEKLVPRLGVAFDALGRRDELGTATVDAALAPFGESVAALEMSPVAAPSPCAGQSIPAHVDGNAVEPVYPPGAYANAKVDIKIALDAEGHVQSAKLFENTAANSGYDDLFLNATIVSAGVTSYIPDFENCVATAGFYLFRAAYSVK